MRNGGREEALRLPLLGGGRRWRKGGLESHAFYYHQHQTTAARHKYRKAHLAVYAACLLACLEGREGWRRRGQRGLSSTQSVLRAATGQAAKKEGIVL